MEVERSKSVMASKCFRWIVQDFSRLNTEKLYSEVFVIRDQHWRILLFPNGNNVDHLSMYLDVPDVPLLPQGWRRYAYFGLRIINQIDPKMSLTKETKHYFDSKENDWGFTSFMPLSELYDSSRGYLFQDKCVIEAEIGFVSEKEVPESIQGGSRGTCIIETEIYVPGDGVGDIDAGLDLYMFVKVARDEDLAQQIGKTGYFDLVDHDTVRWFRIKKQTPFSHLKEKVAEVFGIPVPFQRYWMWARRQNNTYRPLRPLTASEEAKCVGKLRETNNKRDTPQLRLFLDVSLGLDLCPIAPPKKTEEDILLFFKLYDPEKLNLRYIGRLFVKLSSTPRGILARLKQMAGLGPNVELELYEEIRFELHLMCEPVDKDATFQSSQLQDGDIICFQKSRLVAGEGLQCPDVPSFLQKMKDLKVVPHVALGNAALSSGSISNARLHKQSTVKDPMEIPNRQVDAVENASISEGYGIEQPKTSISLKEKAEVPESPTIELVGFMGMGKIEKAFVPLLEEVCSWHPFLIECQKKRSLLFIQWAFTALGRVLHFLKNTEAKDMDATACDKLQLLWEELETCRFDLSWLEPHVQYALDMKNYLEKSMQVKVLKNKVIDLKREGKKLKAKLAIVELDMEVAERQLAMAAEGFEEIDVNHKLGYGNR